MGRFVSIERNANWGARGIIKTTIAGLALASQLRRQGYPRSVIFQAIKRATESKMRRSNDAGGTNANTAPPIYKLLLLLLQDTTHTPAQRLRRPPYYDAKGRNLTGPFGRHPLVASRFSLPVFTPTTHLGNTSSTSTTLR